MKEIGVARIARNNPMMKDYLKTINFWDKEGNFANKLNGSNDNAVNSIFCVFYGDKFLGASSLLVNPESMEADIHMIIGSRGHKEEITEYFTEELRNIALTEFGATSVSINGVKENQSKKLLVK